ncbi:hypothetical protein OROMI_033913 [Orobanche minor]
MSLSSSHIPVSPKSYALCLCRRGVSDRRHLSHLRSFITATIRQLFLVGKSDLVGRLCSVMMAPTKIYVIHGGEWSDDNKYEGGRRELIPIPPGGISLKDLVAKIEMRLMKPRDGYVYEIDALINDDESIEGDSTDELVRTKITDDFELSFVMRSTAKPVLYVTTTPINAELSRLLLHQNLFLASNPVVNKDPVADNSRLDKYPMASKTIPSFINDHFNDDDDPNFHLDDFHHEDFQDEYLDDDDTTQGSVQGSSTVGRQWTIQGASFHRLAPSENLETAIVEVADCRVDKIAKDVIFNNKASMIASDVQRLFGAKIKYSTALSARNQALTMTYGDSSESFRKLPSYFYMLEQSNPGSVVDLQTDEAGAFEYYFMSLDASIRGFKACRPVIVVDGTHLKGKYNGIMFVAATKDANEQIFPLAIGFGAKECDESWIWFLEQCRRTFGSPENLLIVSDQHVSIKNALDVVYPGTPHGICTYHLQGKIRWWGDHAIIMFQAAANAYRCRDFEDRMANLKGFAPGAHDKLMAADPVRWSRSMCHVRRYNFLTSNCAECLNGRLCWARKLPVCTLLECVRLMIGQWFAERRAEAMKRTQELTAFAEARLARAAELSHKYSIEEISPTKQTKQSAVAYVAGYFSTQALREIYAGEVMPTPIPDEWCVPVEVSSRIVVTPANTRQAGRPRQNRMSAGSGSRTTGSKFCGRCFQRGHYQNTCKVYMDIEISVEEASTSHVVNTSKHRRPKTCSICHVTGHTRQTCSKRPIQPEAT